MFMGTLEFSVYGQVARESSRPKLSPEIRVMSPEIFSQVARNAESCGSKFYHAQQHPGILIAHLSRFFRLTKD